MYSEEECGENEIQNDCGSACEPTCETIVRSQRLDCISVCIDGCFCQKGYVRDKIGGKCILEEECLKKIE